jgi:hypothetical protein
VKKQVMESENEPEKSAKQNQNMQEQALVEEGINPKH